MERGSGRQDSILGSRTLIDGHTQACTDCRKQTNCGQLYHSQWYCMQCWSIRINQQDHSDALHPVQRIINNGLWVGTCQRCRVGSSGMKTVLGDEWICNTCWETNGKPKIYYAKDRSKTA